MHERSETVEVSGRWINLPTVVNGKEVGIERAKAMYLAGKLPPLGGRTYETEQMASAAARKRSADYDNAGKPKRRRVLPRPRGGVVPR